MSHGFRRCDPASARIRGDCRDRIPRLPNRCVIHDEIKVRAKMKMDCGGSTVLSCLGSVIGAIAGVTAMVRLRAINLIKAFIDQFIRSILTAVS